MAPMASDSDSRSVNGYHTAETDTPVKPKPRYSTMPSDSDLSEDEYHNHYDNLYSKYGLMDGDIDQDEQSLAEPGAGEQSELVDIDISKGRIGRETSVKERIQSDSTAPEPVSKVSKKTKANNSSSPNTQRAKSHDAGIQRASTDTSIKPKPRYRSSVHAPSKKSYKTNTKTNPTPRPSFAKQSMKSGDSVVQEPDNKQSIQPRPSVKPQSIKSIDSGSQIKQRNKSYLGRQSNKHGIRHSLRYGNMPEPNRTSEDTADVAQLSLRQSADLQENFSDDTDVTRKGYRPSHHPIASDATDITKGGYRPSLFIQNVKSDDTDVGRPAWGKSQVDPSNYETYRTNENGGESRGTESYVTAKSRKTSSKSIKSDRPVSFSERGHHEPSSGLQDAIDYLTKTCTEDFIISQAENVRRLEHVIKHLTKVSTEGCITSQAERLQKVEDCIKSQEERQEHTPNEIKSTCESSENQPANIKSSMEQNDTNEPATERGDVLSLCALLKNIEYHCCRKKFPYCKDQDDANVYDDMSYANNRKMSCRLSNNVSRENLQQPTTKKSLQDPRMSYRPSYNHYHNEDHTPYRDTHSQRKSSKFQHSQTSPSPLENIHRYEDSRLRLANRKSSKSPHVLFSQDNVNIDYDTSFQARRKKSCDDYNREDPHPYNSNHSISQSIQDNVIRVNSGKGQHQSLSQTRDISPHPTTTNASFCIPPIYYIATGVVLFGALLVILFSSMCILKSNNPVAVHVLQLEPNINVEPHLQRGVNEEAGYYFNQYKTNHHKSDNQNLRKEQRYSDECDGEQLKPTD